jgi:phosphotransferase system HPr (HPr) family protein
MIVKTVKVINDYGVHMRPCNMIVDITCNAISDVSLSKDGKNWVDAKSIMALTMLAALVGDEVSVTAHGTDEQEVVDEIVDLIGKGFSEDEMELKK